MLKEILATCKSQLEKVKKEKPLLEEEREKAFLQTSRNFKEAISKEKISLIAEIKKASPSRGVIKERFNPLEIALAYQEGGAQAISIVTEPHYFQGSLAYLKMVREKISLPILRKDFIFDPYQVYETKISGADAILLIAKILTLEELSFLMELSRELGLDALIEVHDEEDLRKALTVNASIIGINHRDLNSFTINLRISEDLIKKIPSGKVVVAESGIKTSEDVSYLRKLGVNAILVGEALIECSDVKAKITELVRGN